MSNSKCLLIMSIVSSSASSMRATGMPYCATSVTVETASSIAPNDRTAAYIASGVGWTRSVASTMRPSVPSAPMNRRVRSRPAEDLRARERVRTSSPSGVMTSSDRTFSRIAP